jgi:PKD repeat protein
MDISTQLPLRRCSCLPSSVCVVLTALEKRVRLRGIGLLFARGFMGKGLLALFALHFICIPSVAFSNVGAEWNPTGNPIGGGPGYSDSVNTWDYFVSNETQLLNALNSAGNGDVIYIDDNAEIDLTGAMLNLTHGVTLASGRGRTLGDSISWGGLLYCTEHLRSMELVKVHANHSRITGLRLRGAFSQLEGLQVESDTFAQPLPVSYYGIFIDADTITVDNCEIWGFPGAPIAGQNCYDIDLHHNYFHNGEHCYHAYGINFWGDTKYRNTANFTDYQQWLVMSGGGNCMPTRGYHSWCIFGHHVFGQSFECHSASGYDSCAFDSIYNCSFYTTGFTYGWKSGYNLPLPARDTTVVLNSWFKNDSAKSIGIASNAASKVIGNWYSSSPPPGVEARIPIASISCDLDSGSAPLTVTFSAAGSYDPDGEIIAYYWNFGDSLKPNNFARHTDNRTVSHTYNQIGRYLVELMVVDNHGIMNYAYKTINVAPSDNRAWLSCWIKDRNYNHAVGYYKKQVLLDDQVCWEKDIAGNGSWEHVILDITDMLSGADSIDLAFRLLCVRDTTAFWEPTLYIDDIIIYGAVVVNGDFESGTWTGGVYSRTDGHWQGSRNGTQYIYTIDFEMDVHSGKKAFYLGTMWDPHYQGDWGKVEQRVEVNSLGILPHEECKACSLGSPWPNPALNAANISYALSAQSCVSMKVYDVNGRFVKSLISQEQIPGKYTVLWDGTDIHGRAVPCGVYFCDFVAGDFKETRQIVWLR